MATAVLIEREGHRILVASEDGPLVGSTQDALSLIELGWANRASVIAVPVARLHPQFLQLSSGMAGEVLQKMVQYHFKFAIVGDISASVAASDALRDLVRESNRGVDVFFVPDLDSLVATLSSIPIKR